jgi:hypothetical protein
MMRLLLLACLLLAGVSWGASSPREQGGYTARVADDVNPQPYNTTPEDLRARGFPLFASALEVPGTFSPVRDSSEPRRFFDFLGDRERNVLYNGTQYEFAYDVSLVFPPLQPPPEDSDQRFLPDLPAAGAVAALGLLALAVRRRD